MRPFRLAAALAAGLLLAAPCAEAQRTLSLSRAEVLATGAADLYAAVAELRPDWLALGGVPGTRSAEERVLVYLDGRHVGDVAVLRGMTTERVASLRVQSAEYVRRRDPRYPRTDFVAAVMVSTASVLPAEREAERGRWQVRAYGVAPVVGQKAKLQDGLAARGYTQHAMRVGNEMVGFQNPGSEFAPGIGVAGGRAVAGPVGAEIAAEHVFDTWFGRIGSGEAVSSTFSWSDLLVLATYEQWPVRVAAGPAFRRARWDWTTGLCGCGTPERHTTYAAGAAATFAAGMALTPRSLLEVRTGVRHFFSHEVPESPSRPSIDVSGAEIYFSLGISVAR
jgi:hypothetical protein